jgi:S1-C subfamily serine protease
MVQKGSVAATAGFEMGDELVSMDGVPIDDKETSNRLMSEKRWGDSAVYKVLRGGREVVLTAYLRRRANEPPKCVEPAPTAEPGKPAMPPGGG